MAKPLAWWDRPCVPERLIHESEQPQEAILTDHLGNLRNYDNINDWKAIEDQAVLLQNVLRQAYERDLNEGKPEFQAVAPCPLSEDCETAREAANRWNAMIRDKVKAKELFELYSKQYHETCALDDERERQLSTLMDIQSEEMLALSMDGTPEEIQALVEVHIKAREALEQGIQVTKAELYQIHLDQFQQFLNQSSRGSVSSSGNKGSTNRESEDSKRPDGWKPFELKPHFRKLSDMVTPMTYGQDAVSFAKSVGKRVIGPWIGMMPESLRLIGLADEAAKSGAEGILSPMVGSESIIVQMGSSLKIPFRVVALLSTYPVCNVLEPGRFEIFYAHAQALYRPTGLCALLAPWFGTSGASDLISRACDRSPELHFRATWKSDQEQRTSIQLHSNLLGAHVVIRAQDIKKCITLADETRCIERVIIPLELWNNEEATLFRKVKEVLAACTTQRFVSGSPLAEVTFVLPATDLLPEGRVEWLSKVKSLLVEVFD